MKIKKSFQIKLVKNKNSFPMESFKINHWGPRGPQLCLKAVLNSEGDLTSSEVGVKLYLVM